MRKEEKGITLIALVITIIVMLILVGVTVTVALKGGLFSTAKTSAKKYTVEKEKELITKGYSEYQAQKYSPADKADADLLEKYFVGKNGEEIADEDGNFINDDIIPDANTSLVILGDAIDGIRILYKNNIYKVKFDEQGINVIAVEFESTKINLQENVTDLELLKKYFLYDDKKIEELIDDDRNFINDNIIPDAKSSLVFIGENLDRTEYFVQYKNYIYRLLLSGEYDQYESFTATSVYSVVADSYITNYNELKVQDAVTEGNEKQGWNIIFNGSENEYFLFPNGEIVEMGEDDVVDYTVPEDVETYVLGPDKIGQDINEIANIISNNNEVSIKFKPLNDKEVQTLNIIVEGQNAKIYIKYDNKAYVIGVESAGETLITKNVSTVYVPKGREGQKVTYSYDGTKEHEKEWTVLYDNGKTMEIISPDTIGDILTLGNSSDGQASLDSYNGAITQMNEFSDNVIKNDNKIAVRSSGSNHRDPSSENTDGYYSADWWNENRPYAKSTDENYKEDLIRMCFYGILETSNKQSYWLASRRVGDYGGMGDGYFNIYYTDGNTYILREERIAGNTGYPYHSLAKLSANHGVRPIVKISSNYGK